jgi:hypothetical protein
VQRQAKKGSKAHTVMPELILKKKKIQKKKIKAIKWDQGPLQ